MNTLRQRGYSQVIALHSQQKDWNEDLKALHGLEAIPAQEHPQHIMRENVCAHVLEKLPRADGSQALKYIPNILTRYKDHIYHGRYSLAMDCMELASALALSAAKRETHQIGIDISNEQLVQTLSQSIKPHRNRSILKDRVRKISADLRNISAMSMGSHTAGEKAQTASAWFDLATSCAMVPVKYEADKLIQQQKQAEEQAQAPSTMGLAMC